MYCQHCGKKLEDDANFCSRCGAKVVNPDSLPKDESELEEERELAREEAKELWKQYLKAEELPEETPKEAIAKWLALKEIRKKDNSVVSERLYERLREKIDACHAQKETYVNDPETLRKLDRERKEAVERFDLLKRETLMANPENEAHLEEILKSGSSYAIAKAVGENLNDTMIPLVDQYSEINAKTIYTDYTNLLCQVDNELISFITARATVMLRYYNKRYQYEGLNRMKRLATKGLATAKGYVGSQVLNGTYPDFLPKEEALTFLKEAAEAMDPDALYFLGTFYKEGTAGLEASETEGNRYLEQAAALGQVDALEALGFETEGREDLIDLTRLFLVEPDEIPEESDIKEGLPEGCFITSAVCGSFGKPDDCYELNLFRHYRDNWLAREIDGEALIQEYYRVAPRIVKEIDREGNHKQIYLFIWNEYLKPCMEDIQNRRFRDCKLRYIHMVKTLKARFLG